VSWKLIWNLLLCNLGEIRKKIWRNYLHNIWNSSYLSTRQDRNTGHVLHQALFPEIQEENIDEAKNWKVCHQEEKKHIVEHPQEQSNSVQQSVSAMVGSSNSDSVMYELKTA
jgi:hypothetical protein